MTQSTQRYGYTLRDRIGLLFERAADVVRNKNAVAIDHGHQAIFKYYSGESPNDPMIDELLSVFGLPPDTPVRPRTAGANDNGDPWAAAFMKSVVHFLNAPDTPVKETMPHYAFDASAGHMRLRVVPLSGNSYATLEGAPRLLQAVVAILPKVLMDLTVKAPRRRPPNLVTVQVEPV